MRRDEPGAGEFVHREKAIGLTCRRPELNQPSGSAMSHSHAITKHDDDVLDATVVSSTSVVIVASTPVAIVVTIETHDFKLGSDGDSAGRVSKRRYDCVVSGSVVGVTTN